MGVIGVGVNDEGYDHVDNDGKIQMRDEGTEGECPKYNKGVELVLKVDKE
jgi:hypothetical protein